MSMGRGMRHVGMCTDGICLGLAWREEGLMELYRSELGRSSEKRHNIITARPLPNPRVAMSVWKFVPHSYATWCRCMDTCHCKYAGKQPRGRVHLAKPHICICEGCASRKLPLCLVNLTHIAGSIGISDLFISVAILIVCWLIWTHNNCGNLSRPRVYQLETPARAPMR